MSAPIAPLPSDFWDRLADAHAFGFNAVKAANSAESHMLNGRCSLGDDPAADMIRLAQDQSQRACDILTNLLDCQPMEKRS